MSFFCCVYHVLLFFPQVGIFPPQAWMPRRFRCMTPLWPSSCVTPVGASTYYSIPKGVI